ncbi:hypothetical protein DM860_011634 [Cuscuta australis]|uniref:Zinc/iron permease n=1 Tax=Cuscuta australis TaxID=267555 RepID=A0A328DF28_9ASTE|nr:hypothetical protein DM860_011634 [Cuscuta australis]
MAQARNRPKKKLANKLHSSDPFLINYKLPMNKFSTEYLLSTWLFFLALLIFPVLGVSAGNDCRDDSGADGQHRLEALKYKLIAVASILSSGAVGVSIPLVAGRRFPAFTPESNLFVLVKAFAAGVILATGFVHVLPDSFESLGSPCLPEKPWGDFPFPGLVAMLAAIATMMVHLAATSYYMRAHGHAHGSPPSPSGFQNLYIQFHKRKNQYY